MISINLNAQHEWERVRRQTEPQIRDVDVTPGSESPDRPELEDGSHGNEVPAAQRRRRRRRQQEHPDGGGGTRNEAYEVDLSADERPSAARDASAYEVDLGDDEDGLGPPPDGSPAPLEPYQATRVDIET